MALVNKTQAALLAGKSRATLYRDINNGKVSVVKNRDGLECLDTSEIARFYGELQQVDTSKDTKKRKTANVDKPVNVELLEYKIEQLEKQLKESEVRNDNSLEQNKSLTDIIKSQSLTLEHAKRPGIIDRLFNKKG
jgi:phage regulator Rha-like protein